MSSPLAALPPGSVSDNVASQSRKQSATPAQALDSMNSIKSPAKVPITDSQPNASNHYTVFIRLPFPRPQDFQDPPPVHWDAAKDKQLWKLISKAGNAKELDWQGMSERFEVGLGFLLMQAAWLYERHLEGMRAQMKRLGGGVSGGSGGSNGLASPAPPDGGGVRIDSGGVKMERTGSRESKAASITAPKMERTGSRESKVPPAISVAKNSPLLPADISAPATPRSVHTISRTPSTTTVTQSRVFASPRQPYGPRRTSSRQQQTLESSQDDPDSDLNPDDDSQSEPENASATVSRSQAFRRPQPSQKLPTGSIGSDGDAEDDDDDSPGGYLPFAASSKTTKTDPSATIRSSPKRQIATPQIASTVKGKTKELPPDSSESSAGSAQPQPLNDNSKVDPSNRPGPLSPRYRAELERLSPRYKKSGSEGSPSIGSSFSDLDDASVTQSALEDALMSNMQHGSIGMGSRMTTLRDALVRK